MVQTSFGESSWMCFAKDLPLKNPGGVAYSNSGPEAKFLRPVEQWSKLAACCTASDLNYCMYTQGETI